MAENPDNKDFHGLAKSTDAPHLVPTEGRLRFVWSERDNHGTPQRVRLLQRYEWSHTEGKHDWYDVAMVEDVADG